MTTEHHTRSRRSRHRPGRSRRFFAAFAIVAAVLVGLGVTGAALSLAQGPRLTGVQSDPAAAVAASGSRVILTANQALTQVTAEQITVEPATPFTVDASGRSVGVRFTVPLDDNTDYAITVADARGVGGGPAATLRHAFTTPVAEIFMLQRSDSGDDAIFRTDLAGDRSIPVFSHPQIEDYRVTPTGLVISVIEGETSALVVTDLDGQGEQRVRLPGDGFVSALQVSDRGNLIGYTYSDRVLGEQAGRESVIFTSSLRDPDDDAVPLEIAGTAPSVVEWLFVPDSTALLLIDFAGDLLLSDPASDADATALGTALGIDGITRGTYQAIVERIETGVVVLDLTAGTEVPLVEPQGAPSLGVPGSVAPVSGGGTVRLFTPRDAAGLPTSQTIAYVADDGSALTLAAIPGADVALQVCVSPSGRYAAVLVGPDSVDNPYDGYVQPLPETVETRVIEVATGNAVTTLEGSSISWCTVGPTS